MLSRITVGGPPMSVKVATDCHAVLWSLLPSRPPVHAPLLTTDDGLPTRTESATETATKSQETQAVAPTCAYLHQLAQIAQKNILPEHPCSSVLIRGLRICSVLSVSSVVAPLRKGKSSLVKPIKGFQKNVHENVYNLYSRSATCACAVVNLPCNGNSRLITPTNALQKNILQNRYNLVGTDRWVVRLCRLSEPIVGNCSLSKNRHDFSSSSCNPVHCAIFQTSSDLFRLNFYEPLAKLQRSLSAASALFCVNQRYSAFFSTLFFV